MFFPGPGVQAAGPMHRWPGMLSFSYSANSWPPWWPPPLPWMLHPRSRWQPPPVGWCGSSWGWRIGHKSWQLQRCWLPQTSGGKISCYPSARGFLGRPWWACGSWRRAKGRESSRWKACRAASTWAPAPQKPWGTWDLVMAASHGRVLPGDLSGRGLRAVGKRSLRLCWWWHGVS